MSSEDEGPIAMELETPRRRYLPPRRGVSPPEGPIAMELETPPLKFLEPISAEKFWGAPQKSFVPVEKPRVQEYKESSPILESMKPKKKTPKFEFTPSPTKVKEPTKVKTPHPKKVKKISRRTTLPKHSIIAKRKADRGPGVGLRPKLGVQMKQPIKAKPYVRERVVKKAPKVSPKKVSPKKISPKKVSPKKVSPKKVSPKKEDLLPPFISFLKEKGVSPLGDEAIKWVDEGRDPGIFLSEESRICTLIDKGEIKFGATPLGQGQYGKVFKLAFPTDAKRYAVKETKENSLRPCKTKEALRCTKNDGNGSYIIPKGSLLCKMAVSEFYISLLATDLMKRGYSIHFLNTFYMGLCRKGLMGMSYTFMEQVDTDLAKIRREMTRSDAKSLYIQILHSICVLQKIYNIVHGDLHEHNIFVQKVGLLDGHFQYDIGETTLYVPSSKYIAKIADWGLAVKYKEPFIGNKDVIEDHFRSVIPNFYSPAYDVAFVSLIFYHNNPTSSFFRNIMNWILETHRESDIFDKDTFRPFVKTLGSSLAHVSAESILTNRDLMREFTTKPKGKVYLYGKI